MTENKDTSGTAGTVYADGRLAKLRRKRDALCAQGVYLHGDKINMLNREIINLTGGDRTIPSAYLSGDNYKQLDYSGDCNDKNFGAVIH